MNFVITWNDFIVWCVMTFIIFLVVALVTAHEHRLSTIVIVSMILAAIIFVLAKMLPGGPLNGQ